MLDLKEYGIVMWPEEKIISFREKLLAWYDEIKEIYHGVGVRILIISGSLKLCSSRLGWIQLFLIMNDFWTGFQLLKAWQLRLRNVC